MDRSTPPRAWRWLLARVLPARDRDVLVEELDRMYGRRVAELGSGAARRWYREEVMAFVLRTPQQGVRGLRFGWEAGMMDLVREIGLVLRSLRRAPAFAMLGTLTLAVGIGANALVFAIADRALLRPLPYPEPEELLSVLDGWSASLGSLEILQRELTTVESIGGALDAAGATLEQDGVQARRISVAHSSPEYLEALGVAPRLGRLFRAEETEPGRHRVALLASPFFESTLGGDPGVLGSSLTVDGEQYEIVGVLPEGFDMPSARNDLWVPTQMDASPENVGYHWGMGAFTLVARMTPSATPEQVREDVLRVQEDIRLANPLWTPPSGFWDDGRFVPLKESRGQWVRAPLLVLLGAVGVVLLVVCANVANLLLSRGLARQRDLAVRRALGAGRRRLALQQLGEVAVLAVAGTALGLGLALFGLDRIRPLLPAEVPGAQAIGLDPRVIGFTVLAAVVVALIAGVAPALRVAGQAPGDFLREAGRGRTSGRSRRRTTRWLVTAQLAAAVVLVTGAGLLGRSLLELASVDPGFDPDGLVTARLDLPPGLPTERDARALYLSGIVDALEADPALGRVALSTSIPFGTEFESMAAFIDGVTDDPNNLPVVQQRRVTPGFFDIAGIPLRAGRDFDAGDRSDSPLVVVVDQTFVDQFFQGEDPLGRVVRYPWRGAPEMRIVGVVGPTGDQDLSNDPIPTVWMPIQQMAGGVVGYGVVVAEHAGDAGTALAAIQERSRLFDDRMAVSQLSDYPALLRESMASPRLLTLLLVLFAASTLVLGCVGVYGVAAFSARERVREIGVRMTIGAEPTEIRRGFFRDGLLLALPGVAIGLVAAALAGRLLRSVLFGVSPFDPVTFVVAPLLLCAAALAAVYLPAQRATRVDPATVLRAE